MASGAGSKGSSRGGSSSWTPRQNKQFECALAVYDKETPDRWHNVARYMGGSKSAEDVRRHFEQLVEDVAQIESGRVPVPRYSPSAGAARGAADLEDGRSRYLKFQ